MLICATILVSTHYPEFMGLSTLGRVCTSIRTCKVLPILVNLTVWESTHGATHGVLSSQGGKR